MVRFFYVRIRTECSEHVNLFIDAYWAHVRKRTLKNASLENSLKGRHFVYLIHCKYFPMIKEMLKNWEHLQGCLLLFPLLQEIRKFSKYCNHKLRVNYVYISSDIMLAADFQDPSENFHVTITDWILFLLLLLFKNCDHQWPINHTECKQGTARGKPMF